MEVIKANKLTKTFATLTAVNSLSLSIHEGEIFGLVGPDGAGKTTTMRLLTTILDPTAGEGWINGKHIVQEAEAIKEEIGYMSQRFGLYPDLTVLENMEFYADIYCIPQKMKNQRLQELLEFSHLTPFKDRLSGNLSGGMKQKLGLACALIHTPKVLFLDEPTSGVDPVSRRDFWRILYELLRKKVTILLATSYMEEAERCGRVGFLHEGKLMACGTPDEIRALMPAALLEVRCASPRQALTALRKELKSLHMRIFGSALHIATTEAAQTQELVKKLLEQAGIQDYTIQEVEPLLEDVFISLLSENQKQGSGDVQRT